MLSTADAKRQARDRLSEFIGIPISEDMLLELQSEINTLLDEWWVVGFFVRDQYSVPIKGVEIYTDPDNWDLIKVEYVYT